MATAYSIPPEEDLAAYPITISNTGVLSPAACIISNGQSVQFTNNSPNTITITIEADAFGVTVFDQNNVPVGPNGGTATINPIVNNRTVNYNIDGSSNYPYAIQVGNGPLWVSVNADVAYPQPCVVPLGGTIEMASTDGVTYSINWTNNAVNPWLPPLTKIYPVQDPKTSPHTENVQVADLPYTIQALPGPAAAGGGGKVTVKGTN